MWWASLDDSVRRMHEKRAEDGNPTSEWLDRPQVYPDLHDVWDAWQALSPRRRWISGMGAVPCLIGIDEIDIYVRRFGPLDRSFDELFFLLTRLDSVYMEHIAAEQSKKSKKSKSAKKDSK